MDLNFNLKLKQEPLSDDEDDIFEESQNKTLGLETKIKCEPAADFVNEENYTIEYSTTTLLHKIKKEEPQFEEEVNINDFIYKCNNNIKDESDVDVEAFTEDDSVKIKRELLHSEVCVKGESSIKEDVSRKRTKKFLDHNKNIEWFYCANCTFKTKQKSRIRYHMKGHFGGLKSFVCEYCLDSFSVKQKLAAHVLAKHREKLKNIKKGERILDQKLHSCSKCDYITISGYDLKKHLVSHGEISNARQFICLHCSFSTYNKSTFTGHLRVHSVHKRFVCVKCKEGFNRKSGLDGHIFSKHRDNEELMNTITSTMYKCKLCPEKFIKTTHLESHLRYRHRMKVEQF